MAPVSNMNEDDAFNDEDYDDAPTFIDMNSAVEVDVLDGAPPLDDDEDDVDIDVDDNNDDDLEMEVVNNDNAVLSKRLVDGSNTNVDDAVVDVSNSTFTSHSDSIYAVTSHYDTSTRTLIIASGGGDDRTYLHILQKGGAHHLNDNSRTISLSHPHTDSVSCVALNSKYINADVSGIKQKELLAAGSYDGSIALYDIHDAQQQSLLQSSGGGGGDVQQKIELNPILILEGPSDVEFITFHPKGGTVVLAGSVADGTVWMYHIPTTKCLQVFVGHEGGVTAGAFTPDGRWVVSAGRDGTCRVWAPKTGMSKHVFRLVETSNNGVGNNDDEEEYGGGGLTCLAVGGGQDGQLAICGGEDGAAYIVHISGKKLIAKLVHFEESSIGGVGGGNNNAMNEDDNDPDNESEMMDAEGETRSVEAVGFCPAYVVGTAHWVATGGVDGTLKIWNVVVGAQLRHKCIRPRDGFAGGIAAGITRLRWHDTLPLIFCSYTDGVVCVWDARVGKLVTMLTGHEDMINDMDVSFVEGETTAVIVTGSDDKTVKVFEYSCK
jgi:ribosome assembly protein SQT1